MLAAHLRIPILARQSQQLFHTNDLAVLWEINNKNTLYTILKRYTQQGALYRIYKGLYSLIEPSKIDPFAIGTKALHGYCYISTESILSMIGVIPQIIEQTTLISSFSTKFKINTHRYRSRKLQDKYLYNSAGISDTQGYFVASPERAIADLLYFNPHSTIDGRGLIDWVLVNKIQHEIGYKLTPNYY